VQAERQTSGPLFGVSLHFRRLITEMLRAGRTPWSDDRRINKQEIFEGNQTRYPAAAYDISMLVINHFFGPWDLKHKEVYVDWDK
jgi:hypothetical protein